MILIATGATTEGDAEEKVTNIFFLEDEFRENFNETFFDRKHHFTARSDSTGAFIISRVAYQGMCLVVASAQNRRTAFKPVHLSVEEEPAPIEFVLQTGETLTGRVISRSGQPVTDAVVREVGSATVGPQASFYAAGGTGFIAHTDARGYFSMGLVGHRGFMLHILSPTQGPNRSHGLRFMVLELL